MLFSICLASPARMRKGQFGVILWVLLVTISVSLAMNAFHVATDGSDDNEGTVSAPFLTLEAARNAIRTELSTGLGTGVAYTVWIHGGVYERSRSFELDERDSGNPSAPITYRAMPLEDVRF